MQHFIQGIRYGYPICCVLEYCFDWLLKGCTPQALQRGSILKNGMKWVPCRLHGKLLNIQATYLKGMRGVYVSCPTCGEDIWVSFPNYPFEGMITCKACGARHKAKISSFGTRIEPVRHKAKISSFYGTRIEPVMVLPDIKELEPYLDYLKPIERSRLEDARKCFASGIPTMCESACFDALCHMLRDIYGGRRELGYYVDKMKDDPDLADLADAIAYFDKIRNRVDHPVHVSTPLEAQSTLFTTQRLILGILKKKIIPRKLREKSRSLEFRLGFPE